MTLPRLGDIQPTRLTFAPGERVVVSAPKLSSDQLRRIRRAVVRYAREHVRVLVVDCLTLTLSIRRATGEVEVIASRERLQRQTLPNVANLSCSKIELSDLDQVLVTGTRSLREGQRKQLRYKVQEWAGNCEVILD